MSSEGVRLSRAAGDLFQLETMLRLLGMVAMMAGDLDACKLRFVEALRIAQRSITGSPSTTRWRL
jgi:hypothetical protein